MGIVPNGQIIMQLFSLSRIYQGFSDGVGQPITARLWAMQSHGGNCPNRYTHLPRQFFHVPNHKPAGAMRPSKAHGPAANEYRMDSAPKPWIR